MKKSFLIKSIVLVCALVFGSANAKATEDPIYTLSFAQLSAGTNYNSYTGPHNITSSNVEWTVYGNQSLGNYIRVGGKNTTATNRTLTSTTVISSTKEIGKVSINHSGTGNGKNSSITVNSITVEGCTSSSFNSSVISKTISSPSVSSSGTLDFEPNQAWSKSSYFRITVNYQITGSNNCYLIIDSIDFYEAPSETDPSISTGDVNIAYNATEGSIAYSLQNATGNVSASVTTGDWLILGDITASEVSFTCTANTSSVARTATVTLSFTGASNKVVTVTQAGDPNGAGSENNPFTVAQARASIDAGVGNSDVFYVAGIVSTAGTSISDGAITYKISDDGTTSNELQVYKGKGLNGDSFSAVSDIQVNDEVIVKGTLTKYNNTTYQFNAGNQLVSFNRPVVPSISLSTYSVNATSAEKEGTIDITYNNLTNYLSEVQFVKSNGETPATYDWLLADINANDDTKLDYMIGENTSTEARTAYLKVYAVGDEGDAYSNLVTISQAGYVLDYATLPFCWQGGTSSGLTELMGVSGNSLGDYAAQNAPYRTQMNAVGDYILIKTDSTPGAVYFGVKMIGGAATSKIKVQESANGTDFTDVEELTISGKQNDILDLETSTAFKEASRYVRLYKSVHASGGNIGIGQITITKGVSGSSSGKDIMLSATLNNGRYWTTFCNETTRYSLPSGSEAFIMNTEYKLYRLGDTGREIPAGTAVIIISDSDTIILEKNTNESEVSTHEIVNILDGWNYSYEVSSFAPDVLYVLGVKDDVLGFYEYQGEVMPAMKACFVK